MATRLYVNNFATITNGAILAADVTINILSATGLPTLTGSDYYYLTLTNNVDYEIVKVVSRTSLVLTVEREQESTTALDWEGGSYIALFGTAETFQYPNPLFPTSITVGGNSTAAGYIDLLEDTDNGSNKLTLTPPQSIASNKTVTFQDVTGTVYVSGGTDIPLADGGSNASLVASNGGIIYSTATAMAVLSGTATAGQLLRSGASSAPSWSTATFSDSPSTSGKFLISDGTNWITSTSILPNTVGSSGKILRSNGTVNSYSTATFADTYSASTLLYSNGANTVTGLATANSGFLSTDSSGVPSIVAPSSVTVANDDKILIQDTSNSNAFAYVAASTVASLFTGLANLDSPNGTENVVGGTGAGTALASGGVSNTFIGYNAGTGVTVGDNCTAIGHKALDAATTTNAINATAIGSEALGVMTSGLDNTAVGYLSGGQVTSASDTTHIGKSAGGTTTGGSNTSVGRSAMVSGTAGRTNIVAIGVLANEFGTGNYSVAVGDSMGTGACGRQNGTRCVAVGASAAANWTGDDMTCIGYAAGSAGAGAGGKCTIIGSGAGVTGATGATSLTTGSGNTFIGYRASGSATDCLDAIAIGYDSVATKATGATSSDFGPGISFGSAAKPVGFRGDGTIIPCSSGAAGFWKTKINGTQYYIPLVTDGGTTVGGAGGGLTMNTASGTTQALAVNNGYVCTNASQCNGTLPATAAVGDLVKMVSQGAGGIKMTANTGQTIKGLGDTTTSAGNITCAAQYDALTVICVVANTTWVIDNFTSSLLTFA